MKIRISSSNAKRLKDKLDESFNPWTWTEHDGGARPVAAGALVQVRYRNEMISDAIPARERRWEAWPVEVGETDWDIMAWKLIQ